MGQAHDPITRYNCARCGRSNTITAAEFVRLPLMTAAEIQAASCDIAWTPDMESGPNHQ